MDETKAKSAVEELRAVVMCLYRSAGNLDNILQSIELELDGTKSDSLYWRHSPRRRSPDKGSSLLYFPYAGDGKVW